MSRLCSTADCVMNCFTIVFQFGSFQFCLVAPALSDLISLNRDGSTAPVRIKSVPLQHMQIMLRGRIWQNLYRHVSNQLVYIGCLLSDTQGGYICQPIFSVCRLSPERQTGRLHLLTNLQFLQAVFSATHRAVTFVNEFAVFVGCFTSDTRAVTFVNELRLPCKQGVTSSNLVIGLIKESISYTIPHNIAFLC